MGKWLNYPLLFTPFSYTKTYGDRHIFTNIEKLAMYILTPAGGEI